MPVEAGAGHAQTAQLDHDVGALGSGCDSLTPCVKHLFVAASVGAVAQQATHVAEDYLQVGHGLGELGQLEHLGEEHPTLQAQAHAGQNLGPGPEVGAGHLAFLVVGGGVGDAGVGVPGHRVADAPEPVGAGGLESFQDRLNAVAQVQVGVAHDGRRGPAGPVESRGAGGGQTLDKLDLAHGLHLVRSAGAVHGAGLDEYGRSDVVAAVHVVGQFLQQVFLEGDSLQAVVPEVVMGVADWNLRFQGLFLGQCQPVIASEWHDVASNARNLRPNDSTA